MNKNVFQTARRSFIAASAATIIFSVFGTAAHAAQDTINAMHTGANGAAGAHVVRPSASGRITRSRTEIANSDHDSTTSNDSIHCTLSE